VIVEVVAVEHEEILAEDVGVEVVDPVVVAGAVEVHEDAVGEARQGVRHVSFRLLLICTKYKTRKILKV
jgi:hypothetical protein